MQASGGIVELLPATQAACVPSHIELTKQVSGGQQLQLRVYLLKTLADVLNEEARATLRLGQPFQLPLLPHTVILHVTDHPVHVFARKTELSEPLLESCLRILFHHV